MSVHTNNVQRYCLFATKLKVKLSEIKRFADIKHRTFSDSWNCGTGTVNLATKTSMIRSQQNFHVPFFKKMNMALGTKNSQKTTWSGWWNSCRTCFIPYLLNVFSVSLVNVISIVLSVFRLCCLHDKNWSLYISRRRRHRRDDGHTT